MGQCLYPSLWTLQLKNWKMNVSWVCKTVLQAVPVNFLVLSPLANQGLGSQETMQEPAILPGSVQRAVPWKQVQGHLSILLKWIWGVFIKFFLSLEIKLWQNSLGSIAMYQYYPCSAHQIHLDFMQERYTQERQEKAQNPDLEMCEQSSRTSLLVLSSMNFP